MIAAAGSRALYALVRISRARSGEDLFSGLLEEISGVLLWWGDLVALWCRRGGSGCFVARWIWGWKGDRVCWAVRTGDCCVCLYYFHLLARLLDLDACVFARAGSCSLRRRRRSGVFEMRGELRFGGCVERPLFARWLR